MRIVNLRLLDITKSKRFVRKLKRRLLRFSFDAMLFAIAPLFPFFVRYSSLSDFNKIIIAVLMMEEILLKKFFFFDSSVNSGKSIFYMLLVVMVEFFEKEKKLKLEIADSKNKIETCNLISLDQSLNLHKIYL